MDRFDEIINKLKDSSGALKQNFHLLEEIIPLEEQMKYFEYSQRVRDEKDYVNRDFLVARLFAPDLDVEERRYNLSMLAGLIDIAAYRALETYHSSPLEAELAHWSALALIESRMLINTDLSGEKQLLVSTGLGGSNGMLRFFAIVASKDRSDFSELQQSIIDREFKFAFEKNEIIVEMFELKHNYLKILLLSGLSNDLRKIFENAILECNQLGDFLDERFMLTNVRQFDDQQIDDLLKEKL